MKKTLIYILFLILPILAIGQINLKRLNDQYCDCFKNLNQLPDNKTDKNLRKCLLEKNKLFDEKELTRLFSSAPGQIKFLKKFGGSCLEFMEYSTKKLYKGKNISDKEYTENIYRLMSYFSSESQTGKLPKIFKIQPDEVGIHYNIFLNKIASDTIYKRGTHILSPHDSLITYNIRQKLVKTRLTALSKEEEAIKISLRYWYYPKPDSILRIHNHIGKQYKDRLIEPSIRSVLRNVINDYTSKDLYLTGKDKLGSLLKSEILQMEGLLNSFTFSAIVIDEIEFPHIISKAKADNLLDQYELLKSKQSKKRLSALNQLFNNASETAYLIILNHWSNEKNQLVLDYILKRLVDKK